MDPLSIAALGWLMSALVSKAVTALLEAWAKRKGLGKEFENLKEQLQHLDALLTTADNLPTNNRFLKESVQNLQQLAYEAQNLLDEMDYYRLLEDEIQQRGTQANVNCTNRSSTTSSSSGYRFPSCSIFSSFNSMSFRSARDALESLPGFSRYDLSQRMKKLAKKLHKSEEKVRKDVKIESAANTARNTQTSQTLATDPRQTSPFLTEPRVFGRDQKSKDLIHLLTNEESAVVGNVHVLAIVGIGGVGKTTLAQLVFNDPKVQNYFEVKLWIYVSTQFNAVKLTNQMLGGACSNNFDKISNLDELQTKLTDKLVSKRFLLVFDDMWEDYDKRKWELVVAPFKYSKVKRGIILVTTRNQSVAKMVCARETIYLQGLDGTSFSSYLSTCIFNNINNTDYGENWRLSELGEQFANKLKGNPLAAKTISALLKENHDERDWKKIMDSEKWKTLSGPNDIMPILWLSYEHMPFHLQRCFSYCALLPKDHTFTCKELVYLWMAQGFLDETSEGSMEDIGNGYFNDLLDRGFFLTKQSTYGGLVCYTFHDLFEGVARMVSSKECLSINGTRLGQIPPTIRHLSIFNCTERGEDEIVKALVCLKGENLSTTINWDELPSGTFLSISDLLKKTKFLRVVRLNIQHPDFIKNFVSLRYLRLRFSDRTFPREICRLYHLEVFEIEGEEIVELPNNFSNLVKLRHFIVEGDLHSKICGVGKLTSLQELNHFDAQQKIGFGIEQLGSLMEIGGSLHICNLENVKSESEANKARLEEKKKLDVLYLKWNHCDQENRSVLEGLKPNTNLKSLVIDGYGDVASPTWLNPSLIYLESLTLENCKAWELLPPLGELEYLKHLKLSGLAVREIGRQCYGTRQSQKNSYSEESEIIDMPYLEKFRSLEELEIKEMSDLKKWVWSDHFVCLKKLKKLTIRDCPKLVDLPLSGSATSEVLERFASLERLVIENCPQIFQLQPLPYTSLLSDILIVNTGFIKSMVYRKSFLTLENCLCHKVGEILAFHELSSLCSLEISNISSLKSLDLYSFVALENLVIKGCQSLTSLTFGEHLVRLKNLKIISCKALSSLNGLKSWVNLKILHFHECPGFIAAWDSALNEIEITKPWSLTEIDGDSLALLDLPICNHLPSLQKLYFEFSTTDQEHKLTLDLESFPFDRFPSLKALRIKFPHIQSLRTSRHTDITNECKEIRNIEKIFIDESPVQIHLKLREEII